MWRRHRRREGRIGCAPRRHRRPGDHLLRREACRSSSDNPPRRSSPCGFGFTAAGAGPARKANSGASCVLVSPITPRRRRPRDWPAPTSPARQASAQRPRQGSLERPERRSARTDGPNHAIKQCVRLRLMNRGELIPPRRPARIVRWASGRGCGPAPDPETRWQAHFQTTPQDPGAFPATLRSPQSPRSVSLLASSPVRMRTSGPHLL